MHYDSSDSAWSFKSLDVMLAIFAAHTHISYSLCNYAEARLRRTVNAAVHGNGVNGESHIHGPA